jgi:hypothetical protein
MTRLLQSIFGSGSSAGVLTFLVAYQEGYASEIARYIDTDLYAVQKQLEQFEASGLLNSRMDGRVRIYAFNPRYPIREELKSFIEKTVSLEANMVPAASPAALPECLRAFFWDYPFDELSWEANRDLIVRRLLTNGSWEALIWLRQKLCDGELRKWLIAHRGRGLSPRQLRYWSLVLGLPRGQTNAWIRAARAGPWIQ